MSSGAGPEVQQLAQALNIPVGTTTTGKGIIAETDPFAIGVVGARGGTEFTNSFIQNADTIFYIGSNTDSTGTDAWNLPKRDQNKTILHLDVAAENLGNMYRTTIAMCGDAKASLEYLLKLVSENGRQRDSDIQNFSEVRDAALKKLMDSPIPDVNQGIYPPQFMKVLNEMLPENAIITIVLFRNDTFGWIKGETVLVNRSKAFCTDFNKSADYLMVAQAFGLQCQPLKRHTDIEAVLGKALNHNGPSFIEMPVVSQDIIAPFVPKWVRSARKNNIPNIY